MSVNNRRSAGKVSVIFFVVIPILVIVLLLVKINIDDKNISKAEVHIEPGSSYICINGKDVTVHGWDSYNVTYFFFPSYATFSSLDYSHSDKKIYTENGELLENPETGKILDVMIGDEKGETIPYRVAFFCSENLYTVQLEMEEDTIQNVEQGIYTPTEVKIISPGGIVEYKDSNAQIKGRGNTSWAFSMKKPYEIRLSEETALAGMKPSNKWTLLSNQLDKTRMLNKIVYDTSKELGMEYAIEADWVDLYANGEYMGNYLLCHEPHIGKADLDIYNLKKANMPYAQDAQAFETGHMKGYIYKENPEEISGGYLIESSPLFYTNKKCGFETEKGHEFSIKSPDNASREEVEVIMDFTDKVEKEINDDKKKTEYDLVDMPSFARRYLIDEVFYNSDAGIASCFFYKKPRLDRLYSGPCWDYDKSCGQNGGEDRAYDNTILNREVALDWDIKLMNNEYYRDYVIDVLEDSHDIFQHLIDKGIDEYYMKIEKSLRMDRARWDGLEKKQYSELDDDIRYLKFFLYHRLQAMTERYELSSSGYAMPDIYKDDTHTVSFEYSDGHIERLMVRDGSQLEGSEIPRPEKGSYGWEIENMEEKLTYYIPVFEDMTLIPSSEPDIVE